MSDDTNDLITCAFYIGPASHAATWIPNGGDDIHVGRPEFLFQRNRGEIHVIVVIVFFFLFWIETKYIKYLSYNFAITKKKKGKLIIRFV